MTLNVSGKENVRDANLAYEHIHLGCASSDERLKWKIYKNIEEIFVEHLATLLFGYGIDNMSDKSIRKAVARKVLQHDEVLDQIKTVIFEKEEEQP